MNEIEGLLKVYRKRRNEIKRFLKSTKNRNNNYIFGELCFCLLTPRSKAKFAREATEKLKRENKLFIVDCVDLRKYLKKVRFGKKKALYIIEARKNFPDIKKNLDREWIVKNVKGLGMKEASHFLRNLGYKNFGIIDKHLQLFFKKIGLFDGEMGKISKKQYLELEKKFFELAKQLKIPPEELDIVIWLYQSREKEFYG